MKRIILVALRLSYTAACLAWFLATSAAAHAPGGVVSSADPRATAAGQEVLRKGGSAADAAIAMMLVLNVVEPQSSGVGGGGFLLHHDAQSGRNTSIDGRETAPAAAADDRFLSADGAPLPFLAAFPGGKSVGVPGHVRLLESAHAKWGRLAWAELFSTAIRLAEDGFEISQPLASRLTQLAPLWADFSDARALYWKDGAPLPAGAFIKNPGLARFLGELAAAGPDVFYEGANPDAIARAVADAPRNAAAIAADDLASYQAKERPVVCGAYRGFKVCGMGPPSAGATTVLQILAMIEPFQLSKLGPSNPLSWHVIAEAMRLAYADRDKYLADSDFVKVPLPGLLDQSYLKRRSKLISLQRARADYPAGTPRGAAACTTAPSSEKHGTTTLVAIDGEGDVVVVTATIEGPFGSQLMVNGYPLNNELTDFSFAPELDGAPIANRVEAGKRPLSSMAPTIVYDRSGRPILALGSAGGKQIPMHVVKTLVGVLDFDLSLQDAITLPNIFFDAETNLVEQGSALADMVPALSELGRPFRATSMPSKINAAQRIGQRWVGAADPRSIGLALSE